MFLVSNQEMARLDGETINNYGLPGMVLMEHASLRVVEWLNWYWEGKPAGKRVVILAGRGNNGGDGLAIARLLSNAGAFVTVFLLCNPADLKGDAQQNYQVLHRFGERVYQLTTEKDLQKLDISLMCADMVVDAIYGTGFKGTVVGLAAEVIKLVNNSGLPVVAVDLPSGLEASTGKVSGPCIKATATITFGLPKLGLVLDPGRQQVGELWLGDISLPRRLVQACGCKTNLITPEELALRLPPRPVAGHKGTFGHVAAVGGSEGMTGAIYMAATAALRSGAGLVTALVPRSLHALMEIKTVEVMTKPLPETEAVSIGLEALNTILDFAGKVNVLLVGPGMSQHDSTAALLVNLLAKLDKPLVLDADALNIISSNDPKKLFNGIKAPVIITPHPGEMARLLGVPVEEIQRNRLEAAAAAAREWEVVVILKGAKTVVAHPGGEVFINPTGNPGMATGGSGDVLAGVVAALVAQGLEALDAALIGVYVHGLAGDFLAREKGQVGLTAGDILAKLPWAFAALEQGSYPQLTRINPWLRRIL